MIQATFTDPQGQPWTNAICMVIDYSMTSYSSLSINHDISDLANPTTNTHIKTGIRFQVAYWPNQAAIDAGNAPYLLGNLSASPASTFFDFNVEEAVVDLISLQLLCETHLVDILLPPLQN